MNELLSHPYGIAVISACLAVPGAWLIDTVVGWVLDGSDAREAADV